MKAAVVHDFAEPLRVEEVAVFGAGGLGHLAVQYARVTGAEVLDGSAPEPRLVFDLRSVGLGTDRAATASAGDGS